MRNPGSATGYRPQRSFSKVMFLHLSVILFTGGSMSGGGGLCPERDLCPGGSLSRRGLCPGVSVQGGLYQGAPPRRTVTFGRYASYWNAFFFCCILTVNTHVHADHVTGSGEIKKQLKDVRSVIAKASGAQADEFREHGDKINFGKFQLECRSTPGHTNGEYSVSDPGKERKPSRGANHGVAKFSVKPLRLKIFWSVWVGGGEIRLGHPSIYQWYRTCTVAYWCDIEILYAVRLQ